MNNHFVLPGFDVPCHFLVGWMVCWWFLSSDSVMLQDANLFDKFASHFLEHFIFHTGIIQSLILVTCSVQDSLFTEANASTAPLSVFRLACHVIRVWKQLYMYMIWKAISGGTVLANFAKACDLGTSGGGFNFQLSRKRMPCTGGTIFFYSQFASNMQSQISSLTVDQYSM